MVVALNHNAKSFPVEAYKYLNLVMDDVVKPVGGFWNDFEKKVCFSKKGTDDL